MFKTFEFVLSGTPGYFKLRSQFDDLFFATADHLRQNMEYLNSKVDPSIYVSGLFNGFTEVHFAKRSESLGIPFKKIWGSPGRVYADSGGLQVVTLGKEVNDEMRKTIYANQSAHADLAFSFDEIPAKVIDGKRVYFPEVVDEYGTKAGQNLKEHINYFIDNNHSTKIIPIAQGHGEVDIDRYFTAMLAELEDHELDKLDCLATGNRGTVYDVGERAFYLFNNQKIPEKLKRHYHLLGVTGFQRLLPVLMLAKNGLLKEVEHLSIDSTSITMSYVMGKGYNDYETFMKTGKPSFAMGRDLNKSLKAWYQKIYDFWQGSPTFSYTSFDDFMEHSYYNETIKTGYQAYDQSGGDCAKAVKYLNHEQYVILYNVYNFLDICYRFIDGQIPLEKFYKRKDLVYMSQLQEITTEEAFRDWVNSVHNGIEKSQDCGHEENPADLLF